MSTRGTYHYISEYVQTPIIYIHPDNAPDWALRHLENCPTVEAFIRRNHRAELMGNLAVENIESAWHYEIHIDYDPIIYRVTHRAFWPNERQWDLHGWEEFKAWAEAWTRGELKEEAIPESTVWEELRVKEKDLKR